MKTSQSPKLRAEDFAEGIALAKAITLTGCFNQRLKPFVSSKYKMIGFSQSVLCKEYTYINKYFAVGCIGLLKASLFVNVQMCDARADTMKYFCRARKMYSAFFAKSISRY